MRLLPLGPSTSFRSRDSRIAACATLAIAFLLALGGCESQPAPSPDVGWRPIVGIKAGYGRVDGAASFILEHPSGLKMILFLRGDAAGSAFSFDGKLVIPEGLHVQFAKPAFVWADGTDPQSPAHEVPVARLETMDPAVQHVAEKPIGTEMVGRVANDLAKIPMRRYGHWDFKSAEFSTQALLMTVRLPRLLINGSEWEPERLIIERSMDAVPQSG